MEREVSLVFQMQSPFNKEINLMPTVQALFKS